LFMPRPGYVSQVEAYEVWLQQRSLRRFQSFFQSSRLVRDGNGRFQSGKDD
jgi:hypothetical protein